MHQQANNIANLHTGRRQGKILIWSNIACDSIVNLAWIVYWCQQKTHAATQAGSTGCKFVVHHCLLVLAFAFNCPLATSGAATSSLSRRMLVSDNSLSLKMTPTVAQSCSWWLKLDIAGRLGRRLLALYHRDDVLKIKEM